MAGEYDPKQEKRPFELVTPLGEDILLLNTAVVAEEMSRIYTLDLDLASEDFNINFEDIIGQFVTLSFELPNDTTRYFTGFIGSFSQGPVKDGLAHYTARAYPWLWFLTHTADCRIFQEKSVPDIVKQIFDDQGFGDYEFNLSDNYREWEYCVQYRETDFNFISRLLETEGIYYYFTHTEERHTLVLCDSRSAHEPYGDYETISFHVHDVSENEETAEHIHKLTLEKNFGTGLYTQRDFDFKVPSKNLTTNHALEGGHARGDFEVYDYPGGYTEASDGNGYSRKSMETIHAGYETAHFESNVRGICIGHTFSLSDFPREDQNRNYLITGARFYFDNAVYESGGGGAETEYSVSFTGMDSEKQFRPARITRKPVVEGPQTAMVTGPSGEEIYTDEHGRVKVQFHWDREGEYNENSSCWIRVAQLWAGKDWGAIYLPRIAQEVIVDFLEGDPDRPIITGRVYNGASTPPYDLPSEKTKSTIKSNSSKGGEGFNEFRFEDKKGEEQIFMHAERNLDIRVKSNRYETIGYNRHLVVENDKKEHIKDDRHEIVEKNHIEDIGVDSHLYIGNDEKTTIGNNKFLDVGTDYGVDVGSNHSEKTGENYSVKAGQNIVLDAGKNITLSVGGSYIAIQEDGIKIQTSGQFQLVASGGISMQTDAQIEQTATGPFKAKGLEMTLTASTNFNAQGSAGAKVSTGAVLTLEGSLVKIN